MRLREKLKLLLQGASTIVPGADIPRPKGIQPLDYKAPPPPPKTPGGIGIPQRCHCPRRNGGCCRGS